MDTIKFKFPLFAFLVSSFFGVSINAAEISAGENFTVFIDNGGALWTWGNNELGQLGLGDEKERKKPTRVGRKSDWQIASAGQSLVVAIKTNGTLWGWGNNSLSCHQTSPTQIGKSNNWQKVSAGGSIVLALTNDGELFAWIENTFGGMGIAHALDKDESVQLGKNDEWKFIEAGSCSSFAITKEGRLYQFGFYLLFPVLSVGGNKKNPTSKEPTQIGEKTGWQMVATNEKFTLGIRDGELYAWGNNLGSVFGLGKVGNNNNYVSEPVQVGQANNWLEVAAGPNHALAINKDGELFSWRKNDEDQLTDNRKKPTKLDYEKNRWATVAVGLDFSFMVTSKGDLFSLEDKFGHEKKGSFSRRTTRINLKDQRQTPEGKDKKNRLRLTLIKRRILKAF